MMNLYYGFKFWGGIVVLSALTLATIVYIIYIYKQD